MLSIFSVGPKFGTHSLKTLAVWIYDSWTSENAYLYHVTPILQRKIPQNKFVGGEIWLEKSVIFVIFFGTHIIHGREDVTYTLLVLFCTHSLH